MKLYHPVRTKEEQEELVEALKKRGFIIDRITNWTPQFAACYFNDDDINLYMSKCTRASAAESMGYKRLLI